MLRYRDETEGLRLMRIDLVRHGQTMGNTMGRYIGVTDEPLLEEGRERISRLQYDRPEVVYVSPLLRCRETAELLYPQCDHRIVAELSECNFGAFENKNWKELTGDPDYQAWIDSNGTLPFPGGEDPAAFRKRSCQAFCHVIDECRRQTIEHVALVVHGGTIMSVMEKYGIPEKTFYDWHVKNTEGYHTELEERDGLDMDSRNLRLCVRSLIG